MLTNELCGLEIELEAADQIDVKSVEIREERLEAEPVPLRNAAAEQLAPTFITLVIEDYPIIRMRHLDRCGIGSSAIQVRDEIARRIREVAADFEDRDEFPVRRERRVERTERVSNPTPFLDWRVSRIPPVNDVPHETAHDANSFFSRHQISGYNPPSACCLKVAMAPTTPAESGSAPGTIRHACTAGLNARRLTSARSG